MRLGGSSCVSQSRAKASTRSDRTASQSLRNVERNGCADSDCASSLADKTSLLFDIGNGAPPIAQAAAHLASTLWPPLPGGGKFGCNTLCLLMPSREPPKHDRRASAHVCPLRKCRC